MNPLLILSLITTISAATVPDKPWMEKTPAASAPQGASTDYDGIFGIQVETISEGKNKREEATAAAVTAAEATPEASVINQIGDGQIQNQKNPSPPAPTASVINQIGDGQIQNQKNPAPPAPTASVINQIGDGQIQNQKNPETASVINQIDDGQIQNQQNPAKQIDDGQVQNSVSKTCKTANSLSMQLHGSELTDSHGRIGSIVANRQFQFDGPPPQAGFIYAAGWSITSDQYLALGDQDEFYQCLSGDFYNLYDQSQGAQCNGVKFKVIEMTDC